MVSVMNADDTVDVTSVQQKRKEKVYAFSHHDRSLLTWQPRVAGINQ